MKWKTILGNGLSTILIVIGCISLWTRYPLSAALLILLGISIIPSIHRILPHRLSFLSIILPVCCCILLGLSLFTIPKKPQITPAFPPEIKDTSICYISPRGKRYHFSESCAGDKAAQMKTEDAAYYGYTPCLTCATQK